MKKVVFFACAVIVIAVAVATKIAAVSVIFKVIGSIAAAIDTYLVVSSSYFDSPKKMFKVE